MLSRAIARRMRTGSDKRVDCPLQPILESDGRLPAEHLARAADIGPRVADVPGARRGELLLHRLAEDLADRLRDLVDADGRARRNVEDLAVCALGVACAHRAVDDVRDIGEVAALVAVAVDPDRTAGGDRGDEEWDHRGVLRERALPRTEDVEIAHDDG